MDTGDGSYVTEYLGTIAPGTMYTNTTNDWSTSVQVPPEVRIAQQEQILQYYTQMMGIPMSFVDGSGVQPQPADSGLKTLELIKKSVKQIKAEAVSKEAQELVSSKIERLSKLGLKAQAVVLNVELQLRCKLARIQEWDYKVLPYEAIEKFDIENKMTATKDGLKVHIDKLGEYKKGTPPDFVLGKLEEAQDRQVFDEFEVLWVEKVKDPLLLGTIAGCQDKFLIAEWGEDISFNQLVKDADKGK